MEVHRISDAIEQWHTPPGRLILTCAHRRPPYVELDQPLVPYLRYRTVGTVGTYGRYHGTGKLVPSQSDTTYLASHIISWGSDLEVLLPPELQTC